MAQRCVPASATSHGAFGGGCNGGDEVVQDVHVVKRCFSVCGCMCRVSLSWQNVPPKDTLIGCNQRQTPKIGLPACSMASTSARPHRSRT